MQFHVVQPKYMLLFCFVVMKVQERGLGDGWLEKTNSVILPRIESAMVLLRDIILKPHAILENFSPGSAMEKAQIVETGRP